MIGLLQSTDRARHAWRVRNEQLGPNSQDGERRGTQQILQDIWLSILKRHPYVSMVYQVLYNSKPSSPY